MLKKKEIFILSPLTLIYRKILVKRFIIGNFYQKENLFLLLLLSTRFNIEEWPSLISYEFKMVNEKQFQNQIQETFWSYIPWSVKKIPSYFSFSVSRCLIRWIFHTFFSSRMANGHHIEPKWQMINLIESKTKQRRRRRPPSSTVEKKHNNRI